MRSDIFCSSERSANSTWIPFIVKYSSSSHAFVTSDIPTPLAMLTATFTLAGRAWISASFPSGWTELLALSGSSTVQFDSLEKIPALFCLHNKEDLWNPQIVPAFTSRLSVRRHEVLQWNPSFLYECNTSSWPTTWHISLLKFFPEICPNWRSRLKGRLQQAW